MRKIKIPVIPMLIILIIIAIAIIFSNKISKEKPTIEETYTEEKVQTTTKLQEQETSNIKNRTGNIIRYDEQQYSFDDESSSKYNNNQEKNLNTSESQDE